MHRRKFIQHSCIGSLALIAGQSIITSCRKDKLPKVKWDGKVIIIGAGISGIYAAHLLMAQGVKNVTILEASNRWGGRILSNHTFADYALELGAEEVHGQKSRWHDLLKNNGATLIENDGTDYIQLDNQLKKLSAVSSDSDIQKANQIISAGSTYSGSEITVEAYAQQQNLATRVRHLVEAQLGNEYGTSNNRLSLPGISIADQLWYSGSKNFSLTNTGYQNIIQNVFADALAKIQLERAVNKISYSGNSCELTTTNNNTYSADKIILTIPISILKQNFIQFIPQLPQQKLDAINNIGMDAGMKILLKFNQKFWDNNLGSLYAAGYVPEFWDPSAGKTGNSALLTAFIMGEKAEAPSAQGNDAVNTVLTELDTIFGNNLASTHFNDAIIMDWYKEPFIQGAYSYPKYKSNDARIQYASTLSEKLYFAGEAANTEGCFATVHGAVDAAYNAVRELLLSVK